MTATYNYDSDDRRTLRTVNGTTTRTLWSGADEVGEYDASGAPRRRFIPDGSGAMDARLAAVEADGTVTWLHTNHQGSVIATSNGSGAVRGWAGYSPSGELAAGLTAPPPGSPFGYTGRQWDAETGLWQYRARYYSPRLGQFLSTDPIGMKEDPNLYLYVGLDPVNQTDPSGLCGKTRGDAESQKDQCVGRWSAPIMLSSEGQSGSAWEGERSIQDHYAGFSGDAYTVDPQTMEMGSADRYRFSTAIQH